LDIEITFLDSLDHGINPFFGNIALDISVLYINSDIDSSVISRISGIFFENKVVFGVVEEIDEIDSGIEVIIVSWSRGTITNNRQTTNIVIVIIDFAFVITSFPGRILSTGVLNTSADIDFKGVNTLDQKLGHIFNVIEAVSLNREDFEDLS